MLCYGVFMNFMNSFGGFLFGFMEGSVRKFVRCSVVSFIQLSKDINVFSYILFFVTKIIRLSPVFFFSF